MIELNKFHGEVVLYLPTEPVGTNNTAFEYVSDRKQSVGTLDGGSLDKHITFDKLSHRLNANTPISSTQYPIINDVRL